MKRILIRQEAVVAWPNLLFAVHQAMRGKRQRPKVRAFIASLDENLAQLAASLIDGTAPVNHYHSFNIYDPKPRLIHAACFADRVLHHALLNVAGAGFEQALTPGVYACRPNKGVHRAVAQVQCHLQHYRYFAKVDIQAYFPNIVHNTLKQKLAQRFKGAWFLDLFGRIIDACPARPGHGLPIGSLTSQHCANLYLNSADRLLLDYPGVCAHLRYMDDIIWWAQDKPTLKHSLAALQNHVSALGLQIKPSSIQLQRSQFGVSYCGFRVRQGVILPSRRKQRRYIRHMRGLIKSVAQNPDAWQQNKLQRQSEIYDATLAQCTSSRFRKNFWRRHGDLAESGLDWRGVSA